MTTDYAISHEQARAALHTGRRHLNGGAGKQLDAHLAACAACRAYAAHLAEAEPALTAALHAQWDVAQPPLPERAFTDRVRARAARRHWSPPSWLSAAPLTAGVALLVLVVVWIGSGWGSNGVGPSDAPQPTEVVVTFNPPPTLRPLVEVAGPIIFGGSFGSNAETQWDIYALPAEGGSPIDLTPYAQQAYGGTWSPDGQWIAFIAREFCCLEVFVMRPDGSDMRKLSLPSDHNWQYLLPLAWSPDSQTLAVARMLPGDQSVGTVNGEILLLALDGSGSQRLGPGISPKWSPDGTRIAYLRPAVGGTMLFTARPDGTDERQASEMQLTANSAFDWTPDGTTLALIGSPSFNELELRLALLHNDSEQVLAKLDADANASTHLHWSPAGTYLLFDANLPIAKGVPRAFAGLYLYSFATRQVALALPDVAGDFSWSPDGRRFVAADTTAANLYEFSVDVNGAPMLANTVAVPGVQVVNPQWRPDPAVVAVAPATPEATAASAPDLPADVLAQWVAFLLRDAANQDQIYLMRDASTAIGAVNITGHNLAWSPDGTRLAFVSDRSGRPEVYLFDPEFWQSTPLTFGTAEQPALDFSLAWSPDGQWLAVTTAPLERGPEWDGGELYLLDPQVSGYKLFPADAVLLAEHVTDPAQWSPDGQWLAYGARDANGVPALFAIGVSAAVQGATAQLDLPVRQLTKVPPLPDGSHDIYLGFAWSPDSTHLAYLRQGPWVGDVLSATLGAGFNASIALVALDQPDAAPKTVLELNPSPNGLMGLSWSPDGKYLLYLSDAVTGGALGSGTASTGCWTPRLLPAGGGPIELEGLCYVTRTALPAWKSDSRYLLLTTEAGLAVVDVPAALAAGGLAQPILLPLPADVEGFAHSPTWQPRP